jgi:hypothetical protein
MEIEGKAGGGYGSGGSCWLLCVVVVVVTTVLATLLVEKLRSGQPKSRLPIPAGILRIPVLSAPVVFFSEESRFLFRRNLFGTPSGNLSVWGLARKLRRISIC